MTTPITTLPRSWISKAATSAFPAEANRYHLYISLSCPYAQRTLITRSLKGLDSVISFTAVHPLQGEKGWRFAEEGERDGLHPDPILGAKTLREIYELTAPGYAGRVTVPVLFDKVTKTIVNNESSEIIQMLNSEFNEFGETEEQRKLDLFPENLKPTVEEVNSVVDSISENSFKAYFTKEQEEYDAAVNKVFANLDHLEEILSKNKYLAGSTLTLADVRLFVVLVRFDVVYYPVFKVNLKRIEEYPKLFAYLKDLYHTPAIKWTVDFDIIKEGIYKGLRKESVIPKGPKINL